MIERKKIAKTPREHFMQTAADELARFVRKEAAFQKADRDERAMTLRLPISRGNREAGHNRARE
jgi:hypothetical protein